MALGQGRCGVVLVARPRWAARALLALALWQQTSLAAEPSEHAALPEARPPEQPEWTPDDEQARAPHHARSLLEMGAGLGLGVAGYWIARRANFTDWDNPRLSQRFQLSSWVLDNNNLPVNFLGHPATGALSYEFARANHQSVWGAFGYSFLTSFIWEFAVEFKEKVSVNDVLVTPVAGLPVGELFYKLGLYLDTGDPDSSVLPWVLGTGVRLERALDGRAPPHVTERDNLGFSRNIWHRFEARYGAGVVATDGVPSDALGSASIAARLVTLRDYRRPVSFGSWFHRAELSQMRVVGEASAHGTGLAVDADTVLFGYHAQRALRAQPRSLSSVTVGSSVGYTYLRSNAHRYASVERAISAAATSGDNLALISADQFSALHLPGLAAEATGAWGDCFWELQGRAQPSFAGLSAPAFYEWVAEHPQERTKQILERQGYFYGWGAWLALSGAFGLGPLRGGAALEYGTYRSQDGLDRHQERLTIDVPARGNMLHYSANLGLAASQRVSLGLELSGRRLRSTVGEASLSAASIERGVYGSFVF